ncbi:MAG: protein kinase [Myxococcales bacterium]|nr:protein kinase [Myxococcales bacterium]
MGEVCLAAREGMAKRFALKVLLPSYGRDAEYRRRFLREGEILASLRHRCIVPVHDFGESEGYLYIAMEYIDGVNLRTLVQSLHDDGRRLPMEVVGYIMGEIYDGLRHAHGRTIGGVHRGVVHRDVTPQNVLISSEGEVFLTDFGIARYGADISAEMFGTLQYIAPEQALGSACYRSDLYSASGVLHFMLTGHAPRPVVNVAQFQEHLFSSPPPTGRGDVPEPLERLRVAGLQPKVERRLASAREGLGVLASFQGYRNASTTLADIHEHFFGPPRSGMTDMLPMARSGHTEVVGAPATMVVTPFVEPSAPDDADTMAQAPSIEAPPPESGTASDENDGPASTRADGTWRSMWWEEGDGGDGGDPIDVIATTRFIEPDAPRLLRGPLRRKEALVLKEQLEARQREGEAEGGPDREELLESTQRLVSTSTEPLTPITEKVDTDEEPMATVVAPSRDDAEEDSGGLPSASAEHPAVEAANGSGFGTLAMLLVSAVTVGSLAVTALSSCSGEDVSPPAKQASPGGAR